MKLTINQALQRGIPAHKEGKLQDAERLYRAILRSQSTHPDANHNLGVLAVIKPRNCFLTRKILVSELTSALAHTYNDSKRP